MTGVFVTVLSESKIQKPKFLDRFLKKLNNVVGKGRLSFSIISFEGLDNFVLSL